MHQGRSGSVLNEHFIGRLEQAESRNLEALATGRLLRSVVLFRRRKFKSEAESRQLCADPRFPSLFSPAEEPGYWGAGSGGSARRKKKIVRERGAAMAMATTARDAGRPGGQQAT